MVVGHERYRVVGLSPRADLRGKKDPAVDPGDAKLITEKVQIQTAPYVSSTSWSLNIGGCVWRAVVDGEEFAHADAVFSMPQFAYSGDRQYGTMYEVFGPYNQ